VFRTLKHLCATEACQGHTEDAYYGHLVLRLMGSFILFYTARVICKGPLTMEEIIFNLAKTSPGRQALGSYGRIIFSGLARNHCPFCASIPKQVMR
jgi:hypothetical protein